MKNKKKIGLIVLSCLTLVLSTGLIIMNKSSFAIVVACPEQANMTALPGSLTFIQEESNKITLPTVTVGLNNNPALLTMPDIYNTTYNKNNDKNFSVLDSLLIKDSNSTSILIGYLINEISFSNNEEEDNYYKQLLILWAIDRLAGYKDEYNYIIDESSEDLSIIEVAKETSYEEKFSQIPSIENNTSIIWKYENMLSAGDKEMLKNSPVGDKMLDYLNTWEELVKWHIEQEEQVAFLPITKNDITYYVTNDYIETNFLTPQAENQVYANNLYGYQVEVEEPILVVNSKGEKQTEFENGESFKLRIPINEIKDKTVNYSVKITGNFTFSSQLVYNSNRPIRVEPADEYQQLLTTLSDKVFLTRCSLSEKKTAEMEINFKQEVGRLHIKVVDAKTKENLAKAEVAIYDESGNEIYRYETTEEELTITLPTGNYTVKQIITPPNYEARVVEQRVQVIKDQATEAVLENIQLIEVPDTYQRTTIFLLIGGTLLIIGGIIILYSIKKTNA